jgi:ankyrin repeat protein
MSTVTANAGNWLESYAVSEISVIATISVPRNSLNDNNSRLSGLATISLVAHEDALMRLMRAICSADRDGAAQLLVAMPGLAVAKLVRADECFLQDCNAQVYAGDTALHTAAYAYDVVLARELMAAGADVRAKNRRGAEPLHAAVNGVPGSPAWDPPRQVAMITYLIGAGADPDALAVGGVTPLQRAVRNRCSAAVRVLLGAGADPQRTNDKGSTAITLAGWTTGRGGSGSAAAKAEQAIIVELLTTSTA